MKKPSPKAPAAPKNSAGSAKRFRQRFIEADGVRVRCLEGGRGNPVIVIEQSADAKPSALATLLAQDFRVVALALPKSKDPSAGGGSGSMREMAHALDRVAAAAGFSHYVIAADS